MQGNKGLNCNLILKIKNTLFIFIKNKSFLIKTLISNKRKLYKKY